VVSKKGELIPLNASESVYPESADSQRLGYRRAVDRVAEYSLTWNGATSPELFQPSLQLSLAWAELAINREIETIILLSL